MDLGHFQAVFHFSKGEITMIFSAEPEMRIQIKQL
jgi:hypothetical protein